MITSILDIQNENSLLKEQVRLLTEQVDLLIKKDSTSEKLIKTLTEQLDWLKRQVFGKKSEKFADLKNEEQLCFEGFDKIAKTPAEKQKIPEHERKKRKKTGKDKITLPEGLPKEIKIIDIPEDEKICSETDLPLVKIGEEITSKLAYKPGIYFIKEYIRPKYALPQNSEGGVRTASLPESLLNRCLADESFLTDILAKKFNDHLPLYRISEILGQNGIGISRQILSQWVIRAGLALKPLYDEMTKHVFI